MDAMDSKRLLIHARGLYDDPATGLAAVAPMAWRGGFASGAEWMRLVLEQLRHQPVTPVNVRFQRLGLIKYGLSLTGLAACAVIAWIANAWLIALLGLPVFYAIEVQFVFLFPAALDQPKRAFLTNRHCVVRAGSTLHRMATVIPLAATMLGGGFAGRGFVRSWALGCLAIVIWYERLQE